MSPLYLYKLSHPTLPSSLPQMRGHAMFSAEERTLDEETLEYAWLVELTIGTLSGKLTTPQVRSSVCGFPK